jgi:hypothetical protein
MANINSKTQARKKVREAHAKANEARLDRERHSVDDAALFLVELGRLAAVDEWEQGRAVENRADGERRRHEHRQASAAAVSRMLDRGESLTAIAELAGVKVSEVRAVLKSAGAQTGAAPRAARRGARTKARRMGRARRSATRRTRSVSVELLNARGWGRGRGGAAALSGVELRLIDEDLRCRAPVSPVAVDGIAHYRRITRRW